MPQSAIEADATGLLARGRQRAFIKIQDGCRYRCTFCIVTLARGEERSRPASEIIKEINQLQDQGIQEAVVTGVHIGGYGSDIGSSVTELIHRILQETDIPRLRIGSIEPWDLPDDFWPLFNSPRFMPHLHLPLQSGSDSVLRRMARRCRKDEYRQLVKQAREQVPDINITTDIIVGFPGETEEEWRNTLEFVEEIGFGDLHIFAYSPRQGTKAASLPGALSREVKRQRSQALHELSERLNRQTLAHYTGRTLPILIESGDESAWGGYTPNYLRVTATGPSGVDLKNRIVEVSISAIDETLLQLKGTVQNIDTTHRSSHQTKAQSL
jgi:threonylcarbamoyladenosine tRNA methylthiotransferase MtaB